MKKLKPMKAIVALALVMVMMLGVVPPVQSQAATMLYGGTEMAKATKIPSFGREYYVHYNDKDDIGIFYKFKTNANNAFYTIDFKNLSVNYWMTMYLMEASEEEIAVVDKISKNNSAVCNLKLKKNTWYYLRIVDHSYGFEDASGNVKFKVSWRKDSEPDTSKSAKKLTAGSKFIGRVDGIKSNDSDWYKFVAPANGKYVITVKNLDCAKRIRFTLFSSNLTSLDVNDSIKKNKSYSHSITAKKGKVYYIRIKGTTAVGKYKVAVTKK